MERFFVNQINNVNVTVGGVKMLKEFTTEQIVIAVSGALVSVTGHSLKINRFDENEIEVTGKIENVETVSSGKRKI